MPTSRSLNARVTAVRAVASPRRYHPPDEIHGDGRASDHADLQVRPTGGQSHQPRHQEARGLGRSNVWGSSRRPELVTCSDRGAAIRGTWRRDGHGRATPGGWLGEWFGEEVLFKIAPRVIGRGRRRDRQRSAARSAVLFGRGRPCCTSPLTQKGFTALAVTFLSYEFT